MVKRNFKDQKVEFKNQKVSETYPITCMIMVIIIASNYIFLPRIPDNEPELILDDKGLE